MTCGLPVDDAPARDARVSEFDSVSEGGCKSACDSGGCSTGVEKRGNAQRKDPGGKWLCVKCKLAPAQVAARQNDHYLCADCLETALKRHFRSAVGGKLGLLSEGDRVLVAVSGGASSSALLHFLYDAQPPVATTSSSSSSSPSGPPGGVQRGPRKKRGFDLGVVHVDESAPVVTDARSQGEASPVHRLRSILSTRYPGVPLHFTSTERELFGDRTDCGPFQENAPTPGEPPLLSPSLLPLPRDTGAGCCSNHSSSNGSQVRCRVGEAPGGGGGGGAAAAVCRDVLADVGAWPASDEHGAGSIQQTENNANGRTPGDADQQTSDAAGTSYGTTGEVGRTNHSPTDNSPSLSLTPTDRLRALVAAVGGGSGDNASAREDLMAHLRGIALRQVARRHGYNKLALGTNATRMAVASVTVTVQGRGDALPGELSWVDDRVAGDDVIFEGAGDVSAGADGYSATMGDANVGAGTSAADGSMMAATTTTATGTNNTNKNNNNASNSSHNNFNNNSSTNNSINNSSNKNKDNGNAPPVTVIRPLRDCLAKELATYCHLRRIPTLMAPSLSSPLARWWAPAGPGIIGTVPSPSSASGSLRACLQREAAAGRHLGADTVAVPSSSSAATTSAAATAMAARAGSTPAVAAVCWKPAGGGARVSINRLCEEFVAGLQHNLASTLTTLHQTALKISTPGQRAAERARRLGDASPPPCCALCSAPALPPPVTVPVLSVTAPLHGSPVMAPLTPVNLPDPSAAVGCGGSDHASSCTRGGEGRGFGVAGLARDRCGHREELNLSAAFCAPCRTQMLGLRHADEAPAVVSGAMPSHGSSTSGGSVWVGGLASASEPRFPKGALGGLIRHVDAAAGASQESGSVPPITSLLPSLVLARARRSCRQMAVRGSADAVVRAVDDLSLRQAGDDSGDRSTALRHQVQEYLL